MAEYANNHFNSYIPEKDIEEQLLPENPVSSNLKQVKPLDDFTKIVVIFTNGHDIRPSNRKTSGKNPGSNVPLSRSWKGLEDIRKAPSDETVEVPVGKFVTLVEQVILLVGQASVSVSYTRRFNILKMIMKDPRKAKGTWEYFEGKENSPPWKKVSISYDRDKKIYKEVTGSL